MRESRSFFQRGLNFDKFFLLVDEGREDQLVTIATPAKRHKMAFRWRADDGPTLNAGSLAAIFQVIRSCIAKKPYIFIIFQGVLDPLPPTPSGSHMDFNCS